MSETAMTVEGMFKEMLQYIHTSLLKPLGWKKDGSNFRLYCDDGLCKIINFQRSQWNTSKECTFFINLGMYIEKESEIVNRKFHIYDCQLRGETHAFSESGCGIYTLNHTSDISHIQKTLSKVITGDAFPFFETFHSKEQFIKMLLSEDAEQQYIDVSRNCNTLRFLCELGYAKEVLNIIKDTDIEPFKNLALEIQENMKENISC